MAVNKRPSRNYPHIYYIDIEGNGIFLECAIVKEDRLGNVYYIRLDELDQVDRERIAQIVTNRNSNHFELWDLMSQVTLGNGINALNYFHQLVKQLTPSGQIISPGSGIGTAPAQQPVEAAPQEPAQQQVQQTQQQPQQQQQTQRQAPPKKSSSRKRSPSSSNNKGS